MDGLLELAAAARARNEAYRAEKDKGIIEKAVEPLKQRIVELEGLLANAVENGDRLAAELAKAEERCAELEERAEKAEAKQKAQKVAPKRGK